MGPWGWLLLGACLMSCGGGAVPTMTPADLPSPRMQGMEPRTLSIEIEDKRPVSLKDRQATQENVARALAEVFVLAGIKVTADSPNVLRVSLERPASGLKGVEPESCVEMLGELTLADGRAMSAKTLGCAELQNALGMSYGGSVSGAFHYATDTLLKYLDEGYARANSTLVFVNDQIKAPPFPDVGVGALQLVVKDDYSEDGSLGRNLAQELELALAAAGVKVEERAGQQMTLTLSHPTSDFSGRDKATCMAIRVEARLTRGTAFGHGTSCRGIVETTHHKVLNDALLALWTEYARLVGK